MVVLVVVVSVVVALVALVRVRDHRRRVAARRFGELNAVAGDRERLRAWVDQGRSIDLRDHEGNTALHLAYYQGKQAAIDALVAYGADDNLRNKEGLSPVEMATVAAIEGELGKGVACLGRDGQWIDRGRARPVYDRLRKHQPRLFNPALVRYVLRAKDRRKVLHLAIKLGVRGSEDTITGSFILLAGPR
ncbi:MAG: hypothetical protein J2P25_19770 [Nocardiopsaceae bacterium]|nr:hypothetical protein [Nocardiopsaceae bacterium]